MRRQVLFMVSTLMLAVVGAYAQTTEISYQGQLQNGGTAANGNFDLEFRLFDSLAGGTQVGPVLPRTDVPVANGSFGVKLDFGAVFPGADRFLDVMVRPTGGGAYTLLGPRQRVNSTPYSIKSASAESANNSLQLGGVAASEYVTNTSGGTSFIRNGGSLQTGNFNISGNGFVGGSVGIGTINPDPFYKLDVTGPVKSRSSGSSHFVAETTGGTNNWARTYWRSTNRSWLMGTSQNFNGDQLYIADESAGQTRMVITTAGHVGIGTTNPGSLFEVTGTGGTFQQRITDTASGNSLVLQSGAGSSTKVTGYNYGSGTGVPLYLSVDGGNTIMNTGGGGVGIGTATPNSKLSIVGGITQDSNSFGVPKAMLFVLANGTISRCWNGMTNSTSGNCGFSVSSSFPGLYTVNIGVNTTVHFATTASFGTGENIAGRITGMSDTVISLKFFNTSCSDLCSVPSDFMLIVY